MNESATVLNAVIPIFGIMVIGLLIRKLNWLTEEADQSMLRVTVNLLLPCLILDKALGNPALAHTGNLLAAPLVGFGTTAAGMCIALAVQRWLGLTEQREKRTFALTVGMYNYGYIPVPLALLLFDDKTVGVLFVHNVGVEITLWTLGLMLLTGGGTWDWRKVINAPLAAIVLALTLNGVGADAHIPEVIRTAVSWLGQCTIPLALILIGAVIADHLHEFHSASGWRVISTAVVLRIGLLPLLFLLLAKFLPVTDELKRVIVLQAAMPSATLPIVMSKLYKGDAPTAVRVVISTSVVGLVTIPLWLRFGMKFVGL